MCVQSIVIAESREHIPLLKTLHYNVMVIVFVNENAFKWQLFCWQEVGLKRKFDSPWGHIVNVVNFTQLYMTKSSVIAAFCSYQATLVRWVE